MSKRKFPEPGFYAFNGAKALPGGTKKSPDETQVFYVTGTTKGNKYRHPDGLAFAWTDLVWTAVPTVKRMADEYDFYAENPTSLPL